MGGVSDRIGRLPVLITLTVAALLTSYPAMFWLVNEPSFLRLLLRSKRNGERSLVETGIRLAFSVQRLAFGVPGVVGDLGVTGVS